MARDHAVSLRPDRCDQVEFRSFASTWCRSVRCNLPAHRRCRALSSARRARGPRWGLSHRFGGGGDPAAGRSRAVLCAARPDMQAAQSGPAGGRTAPMYTVPAGSSPGVSEPGGCSASTRSLPASNARTDVPINLAPLVHEQWVQDVDERHARPTQFRAVGRRPASRHRRRGAAEVIHPASCRRSAGHGATDGWVANSRLAAAARSPSCPSSACALGARAGRASRG
jgi:hypothetical protein